MLDKIRYWIIALLIYSILQVIVLTACFFWQPDILIFLFFGFLVINGILAGALLYNYHHDLKQRVLSISQILGREGQEALELGKLGLMTYDDDYQVTWTSELFDAHQDELISSKLMKLIPELKSLFSGQEDEIEVDYADRKYRVLQKEDAQILYWQDITEIAAIKNEYQQNRPVIGMIHLDNYNDTITNEDEQLIASINANLRQPIVNWAKDKNIMIRRLRSDRFILLMNEEKYQELEDDHFAIMDYIRQQADEINVDITLSMAFARGTNDFRILDDMVNNLLELAQSRGGDQVVMRIYRREVKYFGGTSEAVEKTSKVKARVMARTIKELIENSTKVFIVGHWDLDFDCLGAMLALSKMAQLYKEEVYVITEDVSIEQQLDDALHRYFDTIADKHRFISESQALSLSDSDSLVICVDHHHLGLCSAPELVNSLKRLVVIDHHRRGEGFFVNPILVYVEPSASSSSELVIELLEYQSKVIELEPFESTMMLAGIIVDTNHFRTRSGSRTFEAAGLIKAKGADSSEAEGFLKEDFDEFEMKNQIYNYTTLINDSMAVAAVTENRIYDRNIVAKVADDLLNIKNIEASFVIAKIAENLCAVSARSKGRFNVQIIMEKMDGGGHFSAAGLQRENVEVQQLKQELLSIIQEERNESNLKS